MAKGKKGKKGKNVDEDAEWDALEKKQAAAKETGSEEFISFKNLIFILL